MAGSSKLADLKSSIALLSSKTEDNTVTSKLESEIATLHSATSFLRVKNGDIENRISRELRKLDSKIVMLEYKSRYNSPSFESTSRSMPRRPVEQYRNSPFPRPLYHHYRTTDSLQPDISQGSLTAKSSSLKPQRSRRSVQAYST